MKLTTLGRHVLIEYYNCDKEILKDHDAIERIMNEAAVVSGATIVESCFHTFNPYGVSGAVIISESHLAIHTWPEYGYASVDVFTCGDSVDPWKAEDFLQTKLKAELSDSFEMGRGMADKIEKYSNGEIKVESFKPVAG
ncbi:adenosylmethionine decarboxylase [Macrococcoides caseolyticum]|uniref:adenosylmethionine decarboxylase n=1 Tax=Macrococcoides caseolyticum TaxID=69966 RepID=UPI001F3946DF|nr:adenosylmethionine decarboxylase [Macrococcus caseolyticus]MCE4957444.1 S-adenosylmethionine decarboxylase proenzyme [Macrococcus caseolyticus]